MSSRRSGFSLIEAVLSTFLLLTAVLLSIYVFHSSLRAEVSNEKRVRAAMVAESALAEIRQAAARDFRGFVEAYDGRSWVSEQDPDFSLSVRARPAGLGLACLELESQYPLGNVFPAAEARILERSAADVEIRVEWADPASQGITLSERVANMSAAEEFVIEVLDESGSAPAPASMTLAPGAKAGFRARALADDQLVEDIQFTWFVQPVIGFGSLSAVSRDGLRCVYQNAYRNYNDTLQYAPGACYLTVKATYQGREALARVLIENEG